MWSFDINILSSLVFTSSLGTLTISVTFWGADRFGRDMLT